MTATRQSQTKRFDAKFLPVRTVPQDANRVRDQINLCGFVWLGCHKVLSVTSMLCITTGLTAIEEGLDLTGTSGEYSHPRNSRFAGFRVSST